MFLTPLASCWGYSLINTLKFKKNKFTNTFAPGSCLKGFSKVFCLAGSSVELCGSEHSLFGGHSHRGTPRGHKRYANGTLICAHMCAQAYTCVRMYAWKLPTIVWFLRRPKPGRPLLHPCRVWSRRARFPAVNPRFTLYVHVYMCKQTNRRWARSTRSCADWHKCRTLIFCLHVRKYDVF